MPAGSLLTASYLADQLGDAYAQFDAATRARHLELVGRIERARDACIEAQHLEGSRWQLTVCAADQVGALSVLAGLLTAHHFDILEADAFTLRVPRPPARTASRRIGIRLQPADVPPDSVLLDVFRVETPEGTSAADWQALESELLALAAVIAGGDLDAAMEQVVEGVAATAGQRAEDEPLYPITIDLALERATTRVFIQSVDTPGFLFEFTSALASLHANIVRAEVRTVDGETRDTFWLTTPAGQPIADPQRLEELRVAAALIKQFTHLLPGSPQPAQALRQFGALVRSLASRPEGVRALGDLASPQLLQTLAELLGVSRFLWEDFLRMQHENLFPVLADEPAMDERRPLPVLIDAALIAIAALDGDATGDAARRLNAFKDREMFRIDLRHITRRVGFLEFSRELADLAEASVIAAAELAHRELRALHGVPRREDGAPCGWTICALGKFGGRELGFASDIELLFVYQGVGLTDGATPISNHDYFEAFVRRMRDIIVARQAGIFELDLRLRPYGAKGALASSLAAFEAYYSTEGDAQQFERLALVRLRPIAGDEHVRASVRELSDAWVYSGAPLDMDDILGLRERQAAELTGAGTLNAKYSRGGVVDLEYFVQALQIEAGARDASVRAPGTLEGAELLSRGGYLPPMTNAKIQDSYGFMRRLIDALRVVRGNAKDLAIPPPDSRAFAYLARRLYYQSPADLQHAIEVRMTFGRALWNDFEALRADLRT